MFPSTIKKYNKAPVRIVKTPRVELFDPAWERVYTSGSRIKPIELIKVITAPTRIKMAEIHSPLPLNDNTPFQKPGKCNRPDKR